MWRALRMGPSVRQKLSPVLRQRLLLLKQIICPLMSKRLMSLQIVMLSLIGQRVLLVRLPRQALWAVIQMGPLDQNVL